MFFANVKGGEELRQALKKNMAKFEAAMDTALPEEAALLLAAANAIAPKSTGALTGSGVVSSEKSRLGGTKAVAAYTDEKAAAVHEGIHWNRKIKGTHGFKWYERALNSFEPGFVQRIAEKLKTKVGL